MVLFFLVSLPKLINVIKMKKMFALALGLVLLGSCSSDDSGSSIDTANLTDKKWYGVSITVLGETIPVVNDYPNCGRDYVMFKTGGVFETSYHEETCEEFIDNGTWTLDGKNIATIQDGEITNATIRKLTDTQLQVTTQEDYDDDGQIETVTLLLSSN